LVIVGLAYSELSSYDIDNLGAYLLKLDSNYEKVLEWNNLDTYTHKEVGDVVELSNGYFLVIGVESSPSYSTALAIVDNTGGFIYQKIYHYLFSETRGFVADENGNFYSLFTNYSSQNNSSPIGFLQIDLDLKINKEIYFPGLTGNAIAAGLTNNGDGTFTLLYKQSKIGSDYFDIVVSKKVIK